MELAWAVLADLDDNLTVCILAGGLSRRLRPLTDTIAKPMIAVNGKPFLQMLMEHFSSLGYRRFVLAVGYLWEQIRDFFGDGSAFGLHIEYSIESKPLGTGGAVLWAQRLWGGRTLVVNGDTFVPEDWRQLEARHHSAGLPATMALVRQDDCRRFGRVETTDGRVTGFLEKNPNAANGWINAGVYMLQTEALSFFQPGEAFSLESDVFPSLVGRTAAYMCHSSFADIGTPESLEDFRREHQQHRVP